MAPSAAELYPLHWWSNRYFKKKKSGNYCKSALSQKLMSPLYTQITKNEDFKALDLWIFFFFFSFFWILLTNISIWPMVARMLAAKKDIGSRYMRVYVVCPVHYFPLQLLTYIAVRINKMKEWPHWTLSGKMANQSVKTSNNRFFLSWQVFPRKLRHWDSQNIIYNYLLYIVK